MFPSQALVKRELLTSLRRTRIVIWLELLFVCCILVVWFGWPEQHLPPTQVADSMTFILLSLSMVLLGGCTLFIPSLAAAAITSEREQNTLDLLRMVLIRPSGIVFAKFVNVIGIFLLMVITAAPAIGTTLFGVGLDTNVILQLFITLATVATTCALAGLACSAFFRRTIWAVIGAYVVVTAAFAGPSIVALGFMGIRYVFYGSEPYAVYVNGQFNPVVNQFFEILDWGDFPAIVSPMSAAIVLVSNGQWSGWWILLSVAIQVPLWILFAGLTMRWLRKRDSSAVIENEKPIDDVDLLRARREQFPYYLLDPLKRKKPIEDSRNPMFVREIRWGLFTRMTTLMRLCLAIFAMFFIASLFPVLYDDRITSVEVVTQWAAVQYFVTLLFAPALVANSFTKETELGNMDMIRMTLMRPHQILAGKAGAAFMVLSPIIIAVLVASFPLVFIGIHALPELARCAVTGVVWAAFCVAVSLTASLFARRTITALLTSYGIVAFAFIMLNPLVDFFWFRSPKYKILSYAEQIEAQPPSWVVLTKLLNPTTAALSESALEFWFLNTAVTLAIIALCYGTAAYVLSHHRMQDR